MNKNQHSDILTTIIGAIIGAGFVLCGILLTRVLWPLVKWAAKKAWSKICSKFGQAVEKSDEPENEAFADQHPVGNGLPVPDIFKDSANLGPLREFKL
jgi:hypothetical protein